MCVGRSPSENVIEPLIIRTQCVNGVNDNEKKCGERDVQVEKLVGEEFKEDILAISTRYTKEVFSAFSYFYYKKFLGSTLYKILFHTTQPAHLITAFSVICIAYLMFPSHSKSPVSPLWTLVYLGSFSAHFGAQIWMTFVSGLALYFNLPRHTFGNVQQVLFPKYFLLNAFLSLTTLAIFLRTKNDELRTVENTIQASGMSLCFLVELVVRLYLTPPLLDLIAEKNSIERSAGVGMEIGRLNLGKLKDCPHYLRIHKTFRKIHMSIAMLNIVTMACTMLHLYYLSHKLCGI